MMTRHAIQHLSRNDADRPWSGWTLLFGGNSPRRSSLVLGGMCCLFRHSDEEQSLRNRTPSQYRLSRSVVADRILVWRGSRDQEKILSDAALVRLHDVRPRSHSLALLIAQNGPSLRHFLELLLGAFVITIHIGMVFLAQGIKLVLDVLH